MSCARTDGPVKRITWDEEALAEHRRAAGVLYGTQRIEECLTPFLYYSASISRDEQAVSEFVPGHGPQRVDITSLQERLGTLALAQEEGEELRTASAPRPPAPWLLLQSQTYPDEHFYFNPTTQEACWELPEGLSLVPDSTSQVPPVDQGNVIGNWLTTAGTTSIEPPVKPNAATSQVPSARTGVSDEGDDSEEDVPLPSSRLATHGVDCADLYREQLANGSRGPSRQ